MSSCPKCKRNSLEYSDARKTVWCLYVDDCGFEKRVENYDQYITKYGAVGAATRPKSRRREIASAK